MYLAVLSLMLNHYGIEKIAITILQSYYHIFVTQRTYVQTNMCIWLRMFLKGMSCVCESVALILYILHVCEQKIELHKGILHAYVMA